MSNLETWVVFNDTHAPLHDRKAVNILKQVIEDVQPDTIFANGDIGEFETLSHWNKGKRLKLETKRHRADVHAAVDLLQEIGDVADRKRKKWKTKRAKKIVGLGNHEDWVRQYVDEHPEVEGLAPFDIEAAYQGAGWETLPVNYIVEVGNLLIFHGMYTPDAHAKKHVIELGKSCLYGHTHDRQVYSKSQYRGEHSAESNGCLCSMNPEYNRNKPNRWTHGFSIVRLDPKTGNYNTYFLRIVNGKLLFNGKEYK